MALELTAIEAERLSPNVAKVSGPAVPAPAKMMAARGLAPMGPRDLVTALYQLAFDTDEKVAAAARLSADKLPDTILSAALGDEIDARVIEFFASRVLTRPALVERILLNARTADETFVTLAKRLTADRELEILAGNAQRLLHYPAIIEALYFNKAMRMSTVNHLLELAVRNGLTLEGIPHFADLAANILGPAAEAGGEGSEGAAPVSDAALDGVFSTALAEEWKEEGPLGSLEYEAEQDRAKDDRPLNVAQLPINAKIRLATLGNAFHRSILIKDANKSVAKAAISSPAITDNEVAKYAGNPALNEDVIRFIANKREWMGAYSVKVALVNNPKCPLQFSVRLLPHLRQRDLQQVMRSKNIPGALVKAAKQTLAQRR